MTHLADQAGIIGFVYGVLRVALGEAEPGWVVLPVGL